MPLVCHLRLGLSLRQLPTRHSIRSRLLLSQTTFRATHDAAQKRGDRIREPQTRQASNANTSTRSIWSTGQDRAGQPNHEPDERKGPSTKLTQNNDSVSSTKRGQDASHGPQTDWWDDELGLSRKEFQEMPKYQIPRGPSEKSNKGVRPIKVNPEDDARFQFICAYDKLEANSERLFSVLRGFQKNEANQRLRLANGAPTETDLSRYDEWKSAVKQYPGTNRIRPVSIVEARQVQYLKQCTTIEQATSVFPKTPETIKAMYRDDLQREYSRLLLMVAIRYVPDKLYLMFEAAHRWRTATPVWYVVEDVVELFAIRLRAIRDEQARADAAHALADRVVRTLAQEAERDRALSGKGVESPRDRVQFSQLTIYNILAALPEADVEPWYQELCDLGCALHPYTEIKFAIRMGKSAKTKSFSAHCLERLQAWGLLDINSPLATSVVTTMLSFSKKELSEFDENSVTPADLFRQLHGIGLIPNVITYTTIIRGLCLRGDLGTALDVFDVMHQHGVKPNAWTYATLLHGCRLQSDWTAFSNIALKASKDQIEDPVVWNEVLFSIRALVLRTPKDPTDPRRKSIYAMNLIYSRIFDAQPIRSFITGRLAQMGQLSGGKEWFPEQLLPLLSLPTRHHPYLLQPRADTIAIMLLGLVRALPLPYDLIVFYSQYRQMLKAGHPVARLMVEEQGSFVHNLVIRNLIRWPNTLRVAIDIMKDMMNDNRLERQTAPASSAEDIAGSSEQSGDEAQFSAAFATPYPPVEKEQAMEEAEPPTEEQLATEENLATEEQHATEEQLAPGEHFVATAQFATEHQQEQLPTEEQPVVEEQRVAEEQPQPDQQPQPQPNPNPKPEPIRHPAPSVHTWSILIHGFMKAKQPDDAEYLLKLMKIHGMEPNLVTWNTIAAGYGRMQKIPQAVKAMRRLEAVGFQADDWTMKAFQTIHNKTRAVELMEATVEANKAQILAAEQQKQREKEAELDEKEEAEKAADGETEIEQVGMNGEALETPAADKEDAATGPYSPYERLMEQWPLGIENDLYNSDAEAYLDSLLQRSQHKPDFTRNNAFYDEAYTKDHTRLKIMSEKKSAAIHKLTVQKLEASGTPVDEPRPHDLDEWNHVRTHGLQEMPETPPRHAEGAKPFGGPVRFKPDPQTGEGPD